MRGAFLSLMIEKCVISGYIHTRYNPSNAIDRGCIKKIPDFICVPVCFTFDIYFS